MEASVPEIASAMTKGAFERGLIIETAGAEDEVVKLLPPLIVADEAIDRAIEILGDVAADFDDAMVEELRRTYEAEQHAAEVVEATK
jgi:acetylornithine/succinyldiaminopimelate/putrescine aminotransferase